MAPKGLRRFSFPLQGQLVLAWAQGVGCIFSRGGGGTRFCDEIWRALKSFSKSLDYRYLETCHFIFPEDLIFSTFQVLLFLQCYIIIASLSYFRSVLVLINWEQSPSSTYFPRKHVCRKKSIELGKNCQFQNPTQYKSLHRRKSLGN